MESRVVLSKGFLDKGCVARAKAAGKRLTFWDTEIRAFGIRVSPSGTRSWILVGRNKAIGEATAGGAWRHTIGTYPELGLLAAREIAATLRRRIQAGEAIGQIQAEAADAAAERRLHTVKLVGDDFLERHAKKRRTYAQMKSRMERDVYPTLANRPIKDIARRDVVHLVNVIHDGGRPIAANRTLSLIKKLFKWSADSGYLDMSVAIGIPAPGEEKKRKRILPAAEISAYWRATETLEPTWRSFFRLLALTGQRRTEVAGMDWAELRLEAEPPLWILPAERTKAKREHILPLPASVAAIIESQAEKPERAGFVFPSTGEKHITAYPKNKTRVETKMIEILRQAAIDAGVEFKAPSDWRFHDWRRTMNTVMREELNVPPHIVDAIANHAKGGVESHYNHATYLKQKLEALEAWSTYLLRVVGELPANVIELPRRAQA